MAAKKKPGKAPKPAGKPPVGALPGVKKKRATPPKKMSGY
jgi:hypothetical protein